MTLVDHNSYNSPPHYDLDIFLQALTDFFGGGITLASPERSLDTLRQNGTVQELVIAYQNITNTFNPRWKDHSLIYVLSRKIREPIWFELAARGTVPTFFQNYVATAVLIEQNQAAANHFRGHIPSSPASLTSPQRYLPRLLPQPSSLTPCSHGSGRHARQARRPVP